MDTYQAAQMLADLEGPDRSITIGTGHRLVLHGRWTGKERAAIEPVAWKIADAVLARDMVTRLRDAQPGTVLRRELIDTSDSAAALRVLAWLQSERLAEATARSDARTSRPTPAYRITLNGRAWLSEWTDVLIRNAASDTNTQDAGDCPMTRSTSNNSRSCELAVSS